MNILFNVVAIASTTTVINNTVQPNQQNATQTLLIWAVTAIVIPSLTYLLNKVKRWLKSKGFKDDDVLKMELHLKYQLRDGLLNSLADAKHNGDSVEMQKALHEQIEKLNDNIKMLENKLKGDDISDN